MNLSEAFPNSDAKPAEENAPARANGFGAMLDGSPEDNSAKEAESHSDAAGGSDLGTENLPLLTDEKESGFHALVASNETGREEGESEEDGEGSRFENAERDPATLTRGDVQDLSGVSGVDNPFSQLVASGEEGSTHAAIEVALDANPDEEAQYQQLSMEMGYPIDLVRLQAPEIEKHRKRQAVVAALKNHPYTSKWISQPENAKVAIDSVDELTWGENIVRGIGERTYTMVRGVLVTADSLGRTKDDLRGKSPYGLGGYDIDLGFGVAIPLNAYGGVDFGLLSGRLAGIVLDNIPKSIDLGYKQRTSWESVKEDPLANLLAFGIEQTLVSAPDMAVAIVAWPVALASMTGRIAEDRANNEGRTQVSQEDLAIAAPFAIASILLDRFGGRAILGMGSSKATSREMIESVTKGFSKAALTSGAKTVGISTSKEVVTEFFQEGFEYTGSHLGTKAGFEWAQLFDQMLAGAAGAVAGAGSISTVTTSGKMVRQATRAKQAEANAEAIRQANHKESTLRARSPEKYAEYMGGLFREYGIEKISVPADALRAHQQSGKDMSWADDHGFMHDGSLETQEAMGGDIHFTPEQYSSLPKDVQNSLAEDTRINGEMNAKEGKEFLKSGFKEEMDEHSSILAEQGQQSSPGILAIQTDIEQQLIEAGHSRQEAASGAALIAARYNAQANQTGFDAKELYQADNISIVGPKGAKQAPVGELNLTLEALRSDAVMAQVLAQEGSLVLDAIIARGGVDPEGPIGRKLAERGIGPEQAPGLFVEGGAQHLSDIPAGDVGFFHEQIQDGMRPIPEHFFVEAIENEVTGGEHLTAQQKQNRKTKADYLASVRKDIEAAGLTLDSPIAEIRKALQGRRIGSSDGGVLQITNGQTLIDLGAQGDPSTFLKKSGQFFLEQLRKDATDYGSEVSQFGADWNTVRDWWAQSSVNLRAQAITRAKAENDTASVAALEALSDAEVVQFAQTGDLTQMNGANGHLVQAMYAQWGNGVETYFRTGQAPSVKLQGAFGQFKTWLVTLYRTMKQGNGGQGVDTAFSPEVRQVMDRLIATDEEISAAEGRLNVKPLFGSTQEMGVSEAEFKAYQQATVRSVDEAKATQLTAHMVEVERSRQAWWLKERETHRETVTQEIAGQRAYRVLFALAQGTTPEGGKSSVQFGRLNKADVERVLGSADGLGNLPRIGDRAIFTTQKDEVGVDPEQVADIYGYGSAAEMLMDMSKKEPFSQAVESEIDARMKVKHGDMTDPGQAYAAALKAIENDTRGEVLIAELNALRDGPVEEGSAGRGGRGKVTIAMVRTWVKEKLGGQKVSDLTPEQFVSAQTRHGKDARKALGKGDHAGAQKSKQRQVMNFFMAQEATKAQEEARQAVAYLTAFGDQDGANLRGVGASYLDQITGILGNYQLVPSKADGQRISLERWAAAERAQNGAALDIPTAILQADGRTHPKDLTLNELRMMRDTVTMIATQGRRVNQVMVGDQQMVLGDAVETVVSSINENLTEASAATKRSIGKPPTGYDAVAWGANRLKYLMIFPDSMLRDLDGGKFLGAAHTALKGGIDKAMRSIYFPRKNKEIKAQDAIYERHFTPKERQGLSKAKTIVPGTTLIMSKGERLSVALNAGNKVTLDAMIKSGQFTPHQIDAIIATLDKRDVAFVTDTFAYHQSFWAEISKAETARLGVAPTQVEAVSIQTQHGTIPGGFYPLSLNKDSSWRGFQKETRGGLQDFVSGKFMETTTARGHTQEGVGTELGPVSLDLGVTRAHVERLIFTLAMREPVVDAYRVLNHPDTIQALEEKGKRETIDQLNMWLVDVATSELNANHIAEMTARKLSAGYTIATTAYDLFTAAKIPLKLVQTSIEVGHRNTMRGLLKVLSLPLTGPNSAYSYVERLSALIAERRETYNRNQTQALNEFHKTLLGKVVPLKAAEIAHKTFFIVKTEMQHAVDVITWLAAQQKGLQEFDGNFEKANLYADLVVVKTQGSGAFADRSAIERGTVSEKIRQTEGFRAWTNLITTAIAKNNMAYELGRNTDFKSPVEIAKFAVNFTKLYLVQAMVLAWATGALDDDEDDLSDKAGIVLRGAANDLISGVPVVRELTIDEDGVTANGFMGSMLVDLPTAVLGLPTVVDKAAKGDLEIEDIEKPARVLGTVTGLPTSQFFKTAEGLAEFFRAEDPEFFETAGDLLFGTRPVKKRPEPTSDAGSFGPRVNREPQGQPATPAR
ncbi:MAG: hypothetical protein JKY34_09295 [Kordiimonadaceae bacterium]|nr:hypothetical protein [Kordiimonadaceae bacterium]